MSPALACWVWAGTPHPLSLGSARSGSAKRMLPADVGEEGLSLSAQPPFRSACFMRLAGYPWWNRERRSETTKLDSVTGRKQSAEKWAAGTFTQH